MESFVDDFKTKTPYTKIETLAIKMAEAAMVKSGELAGPIGDILKGLELV
jgi:hypothetical protein